MESNFYDKTMKWGLELNWKKRVVASLFLVCPATLVGLHQVEAQEASIDVVEVVEETQSDQALFEANKVEPIETTSTEGEFQLDSEATTVSETFEVEQTITEEISQTTTVKVPENDSEQAVESVVETSKSMVEEANQTLQLAPLTTVTGMSYTGYNTCEVVNYRDQVTKEFASKLILGAKVEGTLDGLWVNFLKDGKAYMIAKSVLSDTPISYTGYNLYKGLRYRDAHTMAFAGTLDYGQKIEGIIEEGWINTKINGLAAKVSKSLLSSTPSIVEYTGFAKFNVNYRNSDATEFIGQLVTGEKVSGVEENGWINFLRGNISAKVAKSCLTETLMGTNQKVQAVLNKYTGAPIYVYFESVASADKRVASLRGDKFVYGASTPKVILMAYTQDRIERGLLSWDTKFQYNSSVNQRAESYLPSGSGSIQSLNPYGKYFTVRDIVMRTAKHSDNIGANMLLHYVGYKDKADFDRFVQETYGATKYNRTVTPKQLSRVMNKISSQKERYVFQCLDSTNYNRTKLDVLPVNVYQKIGEVWPSSNHSVGYVAAKKPYVVTIMTTTWGYSQIGSLAKEIYKAAIQ